ncbi:MAG: class A beta-lactamase-related serine hydrolase [Pedosphaera sp.]|nr:class A beta-lactamase-related serine hydrolase [Pedosphaera sp.]
MTQTRNKLSRRKFVGVAGALLLGASWVRGTSIVARRQVGVGEAFDREMERFMVERGVPGGALAVLRRGRLVYARGYGLADREKGLPVRTDSLFRIASLSKPITAVAVLKLVEEGRLSLDAPVLQVLRLTEPDGHEPPRDSRFRQITIRHLLHHTGGWDPEQTFDPMFGIGAKKGRDRPSGPPGPPEIIRYMMDQPLQFDPGARYAYSNFGYCLLGRVIEQVAGMRYEDFVRQQILVPIRITRMCLGRSLEDQAQPGEVRYYTSEDAKLESVFPGTSAKVPAPYGSFNIEAMDSHGGWVASVSDLTRFAAAFDTSPVKAPIKHDTLRLMFAPPPAPVARNGKGKVDDKYYSCGWMNRRVGAGRVNRWHNGSLPGSWGLLVRRWDGLSWAVLFNQRSDDVQLPDNAIDAALHRAADAVDRWPKIDLLKTWMD